jgi:hypothetical protein
MSRLLRRPFIILIACIALLLPAKPARADSFGADIVLVAVGIVAAIAVVSVTAYALVHHPTIKGCVSTGPNGLQLQDEYAQQVFQLSGNTTGITPGDMMKVKGKKHNHSLFTVEEVKKDYGVCKVAPATP